MTSVDEPILVAFGNERDGLGKKPLSDVMRSLSSPCLVSLRVTTYRFVRYGLVAVDGKKSKPSTGRTYWRLSEARKNSLLALACSRYSGAELILRRALGELWLCVEPDDPQWCRDESRLKAAGVCRQHCRELPEVTSYSRVFRFQLYEQRLTS